MIFTEGGAGIGFGHIARCMSLYEAFQERGAIPTICVNGDEGVCSVLAESRYLLLNWKRSRGEISDLLKGADIVVIDSYLAERGVYQHISRLVPCAVYLDDNMRIDYPGGVVVNGGIYGKELNYPHRDGVTFLLGSRYMLLRKEFRNVPRREVRDTIENVLITFGGDDMRDMTPGVLRLLVDQFPEIRKKVIIGNGFKDVGRIETIADSVTELVYSPTAAEIRNVMIDSDIAISAAGQTLGELAHVGVPAIAVGIADNQVNNVKGWSKRGYIQYAGWYDDTYLNKTLLSCIERLRSKYVRNAKSSRGRRLVDGMGSLRIVEHVLRELRN